MFIKKIILILLFSTIYIFTNNVAFGQINKTDSLENKLKQAFTIYEKTLLLQDLVFLNILSNEKEEYYQRAKQLLVERSDELSLANVDLIKCKIECEKKRYSTTLLEEALVVFEIYKKNKVKYRQQFRILSLLSDIYNFKNETSTAIRYSLAAIKLTEKELDRTHNLHIERVLGSAYIDLGLKCSLIGSKKGIEYAEKGIKILELIAKPKLLVGSYGNYSIILRRAEKYDTALLYAKKMKVIIDSTNNVYRQAKVNQLIGSIYYELEDFQQSINYQKLAIKQLEKIDKKVELSVGLYNLGKAYQKKNEFDISLYYLEEALKIAKNEDNKDILVNIYGRLSEVYKEKDNNAKAYDYLVIAKKYEYEIKEKRKEKEMEELVVKYETEKKEQQIKDLQQQKTIEDLKNKQEVSSLQAQRSILGLVLLAPISLLIGGGWYVNRRRLHLQLEAEQKERAKQLSELKAIRSQMNPHFIFNALNSIQDFILLSEKENASLYLGKFATLMRGFLDSSSKSRISLEKELPLLKSYIELEGLRLGEEFSYEINFDSSINEDELDEIKIPPLLIQPYLENAFKHGLLHKKGDKKLTLDFNKTEKSGEQFLQLKIKDNGIGRQKSAEINTRKAQIHNSTHTSFATQATTERLELLKNQSASNAAIEVEIIDLKDSQGNAAGTKVIILIPINE